MSLKEQIQADVSAVFLNPDDFAEPVDVFGLAGGTRTVVASVDREHARREEGQAHRTRVWQCTVAFRDDDTPGAEATGVGYAEIERLEAKGKRFSIRLAEDKATDRWDFQEVMNSDSGMVVCRFEKARQLETGRLTPNNL